MTDQDFGTGKRTVNQLCVLVNRLGRTLHCLQFAEGLNPAQWEALRYVGRANRFSRTPSALAEYLGTTKGTASQTINALVNKGYVTRCQHSADRRTVRLEITDSGRLALQQDPLKRFEAAAEELEPDIETAHALLSRLVDGLRSSSSTSSCTKPDFGICSDCTHFCKNADAADEAGPHRCGLAKEPLTASESQQICVNHLA